MGGTISREGRLVQVFVELADTLVQDYEPLDFLDMLCDRVVELLDVSAAGVLLADEQGTLRVVAASSERVRALELFEMQHAEGPCLDAYRSGEQVVEADLAAEAGRWRRFVPQALGCGYRAVFAFPLRLRGQRIGALNAFRETPGPFPPADILVGQAMADIAAVGILQERALSGAERLSEQLQGALHSRVLIEQAKGILAERHGIDPDVAFEVVRRYARSHNRSLRDVARDVVEGRLSADELPLPGPRRP